MANNSAFNVNNRSWIDRNTDQQSRDQERSEPSSLLSTLMETRRILPEEDSFSNLRNRPRFPHRLTTQISTRNPASETYLPTGTRHEYPATSFNMSTVNRETEEMRRVRDDLITQLGSNRSRMELTSPPSMEAIWDETMTFETIRSKGAALTGSNNSNIKKALMEIFKNDLEFKFSSSKTDTTIELKVSLHNVHTGEELLSGSDFIEID